MYPHSIGALYHAFKNTAQEHVPILTPAPGTPKGLKQQIQEGKFHQYTKNGGFIVVYCWFYIGFMWFFPSVHVNRQYHGHQRRELPDGATHLMEVNL